MLPSTIHAVLRRELAAVRRSVESYPDDASIWAEPEGLPNSGGTLVLHLAGNLQHYVGALLGASGYRRDRDAEFARRGVPRAELLREIAAAESAVDRGMRAVNEAALDVPFPEPINGRSLAMGDVLVHLSSHLAYHLGQLDYHRRLVCGDRRGIGAVAAAELPVR